MAGIFYISVKSLPSSTCHSPGLLSRVKFNNCRQCSNSGMCDSGIVVSTGGLFSYYFMQQYSILLIYICFSLLLSILNIIDVACPSVLKQHSQRLEHCLIFLKKTHSMKSFLLTMQYRYYFHRYWLRKKYLDCEKGGG